MSGLEKSFSCLVAAETGIAMNDLGISSAPVWRDKKSSGSYSPAGTPRTQPFGGNSCYPGLNDSCDDDSAFLPGFSTTIDGDGESRKLANMVRKGSI